jgi:acyl-CoA synthetase (AMP-forming)/AMP-acid ligase II
MRFQGNEPIGMLYEIPAANAFILPVLPGKKNNLNIHPCPVFTITIMDDTGYFTIKDLIFNGNQDPNHHAIECPGYRPLTYRDLRLQVLYVVKALNAMGFHRNDRIAVIMPAGPETAVIIISVMAGFTSVPLNPQSSVQEFSRNFSQLKINAIIIQKGHDTAAAGVAKSQNIPVIELVPVSGFAGKFELEPKAVKDTKEVEFATPSDIVVLLLTSGTTGTQKIVPITQRQFTLTKQRMINAIKITNTERFLHILPYYHAMGLGTPLLGTLLAGGTVICTKDFIASDFLPLLKTYRPTYSSAGPAVLRAILREIKKASPEELKDNSLRGIRSGSAPLSAAITQELGRLLGTTVTDGYSMSEAGMISINLPPREGSVGIPVIESLTIRDEDGKILRIGETGEIVVKGETVFNGYEGAPEENKAVFIDGGFRTGDMGYLDNDGYLYIIGRKKEIINKGGEKISPVEIDTELCSHPGVKDAMSFPVYDQALGEDIAAMVVPADKKVTEADLRNYLLNRLVQFKVPRRIFFVDEIPKTPSGKPMRYEGTRRYS